MFLEIASGKFQIDVALLVGSAGTEASANKGRECSSLEQEDGEDDAETETNSRFDNEVREAAIPLVTKFQALSVRMAKRARCVPDMEK